MHEIFEGLFGLVLLVAQVVVEHFFPGAFKEIDLRADEVFDGVVSQLLFQLTNFLFSDPVCIRHCI